MHQLSATLQYRTEENFGSKKLWRMGLTADLAKKTLADLAKSSNNGWYSKKCAGGAKGILIIIIIIE